MRFLLLPGFFLALVAGAAPLASWNFDWDYNIARIDSPIYLFKKGTFERKVIHSDDYAKFGADIGVRGEYAAYEVRREKAHNTFENFFDPPGVNGFLKTLRETVESETASQWQAPAWGMFREACAHPETAKWVSIITAREHKRESLLAGLRYLQARGLLRYLPALNHLYPVGNREYRQGAATIPEAKERTMEHLLDELSAQALPAGQRHEWVFSDDDLHNIEQARQVISSRLKENRQRWSNLKIFLWFTGTNLPQTPPFQLVMQPDGTDRPASAAEWQQAQQALRASP